MNRKTLGQKYIVGSGVEIGALAFPWDNPNGAAIKYIDRYPRLELVAQYPEHDPAKIIEVDIVDDGSKICSVGDLTQDFVVNSHVLEHVEDPIRTLRHWLRVLIPGGHLLMAIPEMTKTFDRQREPTTWEHVRRDYEDPGFLESYRAAHYEEYFVKVDRLSGKALEAAVAAAIKNENHVHFHCWTEASLRDFFEKTRSLVGGFSIVEFAFSHHEVFVVLRKD